MNDFYINSERIKLVKRIGKGGEGEVFTISGEMPRVAKIYTIQDLKEREEKIKAMIKNHLAQNNNFVSFPIEIVLDGKKQFRGFTMKQIVSHKPIFELYAPGARKKNFPKSDYRFLVRTASNIARAVQSVHDINCVIGDINHSSILVSDKATVALIDADSFQFNINNQNYFCKVGVAEYTPPELHGSKLDQIVRTINHDSFGLAVIIFQLLFLGRHPFSGNFKDKDLTIAEAIQKNKFIYSIANRVEAEIPPAVPRLQDFSENIIQLFEKAFSEKKHRPAASAWVNALSDFEKTLIKCQKFETHYYPSFRKTCLWCDLELTSGVSIFPTKKNTTSINLKNHELINIFLNIEFVPFFPSDYIPPVSYQPRNEISKLKFFSKSRATLILVVLFLISLFTVKSAPILPVILFFATWIIPNILNSAEKEAKLIKEELDKIDLELNRIWTSYHSNRNLKELYIEKENADIIIKEIQTAENQFLEIKHSLSLSRKNRALIKYLDKFFIKDAKLKNINISIISQLASYGIETAADIRQKSKIKVPGVGIERNQELRLWVAKLEAQFVYQESKSDDQREIDLTKKIIFDHTSNLLAELKQIINKIENLNNSIKSKSKRDIEYFRSSFQRRQQLLSDLKFLNITTQSRDISSPAKPSATRIARKIDVAKIVENYNFSLTVNQTSPPPTIQIPTQATRNSSNSNFVASAVQTAKTTTAQPPTGNPPNCPRCRSSMVQRLAKRGQNKGNYFWGCSNYPRCKGTRPL